MPSLAPPEYTSFGATPTEGVRLGGTKAEVGTPPEYQESVEKPYSKPTAMTLDNYQLNDQNKLSSNQDHVPRFSTKYWGPRREVVVHRQHEQPLGISIVGGKVDLTGNQGGDTVMGIFVKNVIAESPAGRTGELATGDRIVEVDGIALCSADHEAAVSAIRNAGNPINFVVQRLQHWSSGSMSSVGGGHTTSDICVNKVKSPLLQQTTTAEAEANQGPPTKLIIPDVFSGPNSGLVNGIPTTSNSTRTGSPNSSSTNDVHYRRHSEAIGGSKPIPNVNSPRAISERNSLLSPSCTAPTIEAQQLNLDHELTERDEAKSNGNPFQNDRLAVWQTNSHVLTPEGPQDQAYSYGYKSITETPPSPELKTHRMTIDQNKGGSDMPTVQEIQDRRPSSPEVIQRGLTDLERQTILQKIDAAQLAQNKASKQDLQQKPDKIQVKPDYEDGSVRMVIAQGKKILDNQESNIKKQQTLTRADSESSDEQGLDEEDYNEEIHFGKLDGQLIRTNLEPNKFGLGISLAGSQGHKNRDKMRTYICGMHPQGPAAIDKTLAFGDELLKVGDHIVRDRCHLNVSSLIKSITEEKVSIIALRSTAGIEEISVKPVNSFPLILDDVIFGSEEFERFTAKREIKVYKGKLGLGIMIIEGHHKEVGKGIFVSDIQQQSAAFHAGLKVGDMILAINTDSFLSITYDEAVAIIKGLGGKVRMLVTDPNMSTPTPQSQGDTSLSRSSGPAETTSAPDSAKPSATASKPAAAETDKPAPVTAAPTTKPANGSAKPAAEAAKPPTAAAKPAAPPAATEIKTEPAKNEKKFDNKIELKKDSGGLGLSIVGGSDTPLGGVIVHEVYADGAADRDGRLRPGDVIISVNDHDFRGLSHKEALHILRSAHDKVVLQIDRPEDGGPESLYEDLEVDLSKKPGKGLGLSVVGRRAGTGVFISDLVAGGVADSNGKLLHGDQIIKVNDKDLSNATQDSAVAILKMTSGTVKLKVRRLKIITK